MNGLCHDDGKIDDCCARDRIALVKVAPRTEWQHGAHQKL
jgi:hypothetical protein